MSEYWKEVSNDKLNIIPAVTHSGNATYETRTGIINSDTLLPNGKNAIKYFTLNKNKYGLDPSSAYFLSYDYYSYDSNNNPRRCWSSKKFAYSNFKLELTLQQTF